MGTRIRSLFVQQTTPDELLVFLLLVAAAALLVAFALYALVLAGIWRWRHGGLPPLRRLFLPSGRQVRRHLGEYSVATVTSLLLMLTVAARDQAVRAVLDYPLDQLSTAEIQAAFPLGAPSAAELVSGPGVASDDVSLALERFTATALVDVGVLAPIGVGALLRPTVEAGRAEQAGALTTAAIQRLGGGGLVRFPTARHLLVVAVLLLVGSAAGFAWARGRAIRSPNDVHDTEFRRMFRRLAVPAVCISLLLASAAAAADSEQRLVRSALAAAVVEPRAPPGSVEERFHNAIDSQTRTPPPPFADPEALSAALARIERRLYGLEARAGQRGAEVDSLHATTASLHAALASVRDAMAADAENVASALDGLGARLDLLARGLAGSEAALASVRADALRADSLARVARARGDEAVDAVRMMGVRVDSVGRALAALARQRAPDTGLLLVAVRPEVSYVITGGPTGQVRIDGVGTGLHALQPGRYRITSDVGSRDRHIDAGSAATVRIEQPVLNRPQVEDAGPAVARPPTVPSPPGR